MFNTLLLFNTMVMRGPVHPMFPQTLEHCFKTPRIGPWMINMTNPNIMKGHYGGQHLHVSQG